MKNTLLCTAILLLFCATAFAQEIEGRITDSKGDAIESAYIYNQRTGSHAHSNTKGLFILGQTITGDTLLLNLIGYKNRLVVVQDYPVEVVLQEAPFELEQVVITPELKSLNTISAVNLNLNPVKSSQEILRVVPGLVIGQHAGGGKAEQIFLRGFDIDHGTDISISADGIPVNMVSHAHGQGYADLHFLIPETIEKVDFGKGPYYADKGNFATAGYVNLQTYDKIDQSRVAVEYGDFNTLRAVGLLKLINGSPRHNAYLASEYYLTDGPFESPQNFNRLNLMAKYTGWVSAADKLSLQASLFQSRWDASGQIPLRAVESDLISRFGAIDDTEGGSTSRVNLLARLDHIIDPQTFVRNKLFFSAYDFKLYSNFTFFLNDPVFGDQIRQQENRSIYGVESEFNKRLDLLNTGADIKAGIGFRSDMVEDIELSHTLNRRTTLDAISLGDIIETNFYTYLDAEIELGEWLVNPAIRLDYFDFLYIDHLSLQYISQSENEVFASPKLNISYSPTPYLQLYLKNGIGFHSNDTRVVVARQGRQILPAAYGTDLGLNWKPSGRLLMNAALWHLFLEQEFVYVGDEGVVEPSGKTRRMGVDLGIHYQALNWLFFDTELSYAHARALEEDNGQNYIPLAPAFTASGGFSVTGKSGLNGGLRGRYLADRPANEDNSVVAEGYFVVDMNLSHTYRNFTYGLVIENLFNTEWNETQFNTETRLAYEEESVSEIHFTPGTPFFIKGRVALEF
ncbi:TonB-dependent receptor [Nafulsella turpanensis]|uniref:TonB-dependent receptor n=1 Tax=Nafulsella turpanensis TaxID=1265690 RepID=UPI00037436AB|nr:TonB-dependent receptor plug domain-containing protein [Nafulsella turpanensis]